MNHCQYYKYMKHQLSCTLHEACNSAYMKHCMRQKPLGEEAVNRKEKPQINALEDTNGEEEAPVVVGADPVEVP